MTITGKSPQNMDEVLDAMEPYVLEHHGHDSAAWRSGDFTAGAMLEFKAGTSDARAAHWTVADLREFLMNWLPAYVQTDDDVLHDVPDCTAVFFNFLASAGLLTGDPLGELTAASADLSDEFHVACRDAYRWSPAKSRLAAIADTVTPGETPDRRSRTPATADQSRGPRRTRGAAGPRSPRSGAWPRFADR